MPPSLNPFFTLAIGARPLNPQSPKALNFNQNTIYPTVGLNPNLCLQLAGNITPGQL